LTLKVGWWFSQLKNIAVATNVVGTRDGIIGGCFTRLLQTLFLLRERLDLLNGWMVCLLAGKPWLAWFFV
jgi:hypothetical protein